jgi:hypothetical protein
MRRRLHYLQNLGILAAYCSQYLHLTSDKGVARLTSADWPESPARECVNRRSMSGSSGAETCLRPRGRIAVLVPLVIVLLLVTASSASAHGDSTFVSERVTIAAGESAEFQADLHYHRLIGRIEATGPVQVRLINVRTNEVAHQYGPGASLSFNTLVECCDDQVWAPYTLIIDNRSGESVSVEAMVRLAHDDLAVMVYGAESGTRGSIPVFAVIWGAVLWRVSRGRKPPISIRRSLALTGSLVSLVAALLVLGTVRYVTGGPPALLAGLSDISLMPDNPVVSGTSLALAVLLFTWGAAGVWWFRARPVTRRLPWAAHGLLLIALVAAAAIAIALTYDVIWYPMATALIAIVPVMVVLYYGLKSGPAEDAALDPATTVLLGQAVRPGAHSAPARSDG